MEHAQLAMAAGESLIAVAGRLDVTVVTARGYLEAERCPRCGDPVAAERRTSGYCEGCIGRAVRVTLFSTDEILARVEEWVRRTGRAPRPADWAPAKAGPPNRFELDFPHWPAERTAASAFGSWRGMFRAAGLPSHHHEPWTRQDILEALVEGAARLGRSPRVSDATEDPLLPYPETVTGFFVSWNAALAEVGLPATRQCRRWDRASIVEALQDFARTHDRTPTSLDFQGPNTPRWPTPLTVSVHFGSWSAAVEAAGLSRPRRRRPTWEDAALIAALRAYAGEHDRSPRARDFAAPADRQRWPAPATVIKRFGSWRKALELADLEGRKAQS